MRPIVSTRLFAACSILSLFSNAAIAHAVPTGPNPRVSVTVRNTSFRSRVISIGAEGYRLMPNEAHTFLLPAGTDIIEHDGMNSRRDGATLVHVGVSDNMRTVLIH